MTERTPIDLFHTVNGLRLHTAFWPGEGDPVLLLHATGFHARCWDEIVRRLPGRPVYAVDLPCHGLSDAVRPPPGCAFRARCPHALPACEEAVPPLRAIAAGHRSACIRDDI